jgi:hypothetical protein
MRCVLLERVRYRLPGGTDRLVWGVVVAEADGFYLLFVRKPDDNWPDMLVVTTPSEERIFEDFEGFQFPVDRGLCS